jgi:hypothetical protein
MFASRRIFIVSSSHPYHNCKIPFLYEPIMTPFMTPRRRRYLFLLSISSRASTSHIVFAPIMFVLHSHSASIKVVPCLCHYRSSVITFTREPFDKAKSFISSSYFPTPHTVGCFDCTLYIMYYQNCRFCLICTNTSYVTPDFHTIPTPGYLLILQYSGLSWSLSLVIMRVNFGIGVV